MKAASAASRRPLRVLALAMLAAAACGKKNDERRTAKPVAPVTQPDKPLIDTIVKQAGAAPAWTQEAPRFFSRGGVRLASAVGWAKSRNISVGRAAAEDRARVDLLRLISGLPSANAVSGDLPGASATDAYTSKDGMIYVRVEIAAPPGR
jgi:hypothetical protein